MDGQAADHAQLCTCNLKDKKNYIYAARPIYSEFSDSGVAQW